VQVLNASITVTANASGAATARIGPDSSKGPATWDVRKVSVRNEDPARRGKSPVPTCNVYVDNEGPNEWQDGTYDGSFDSSDCSIPLSRGQVLIAVWAGAQSGDRLTLSVGGLKGES
jgi:hypothetical protein